jgi:enterochelin esterase-like enzyme
MVPHIDATYRTLARRESRGIEGTSLGGYGAALHLGMTYPDLFGTISSVDPAILRDLEDEPRESTFDTNHVYEDIVSGPPDGGFAFWREGFAVSGKRPGSDRPPR